MATVETEYETTARRIAGELGLRVVAVFKGDQCPPWEDGRCIHGEKPAEASPFQLDRRPATSVPIEGLKRRLRCHAATALVAYAADTIAHAAGDADRIARAATRAADHAARAAADADHVLNTACACWIEAARGAA